MYVAGTLVSTIVSFGFASNAIFNVFGTSFPIVSSVGSDRDGVVCKGPRFGVRQHGSIVTTLVQPTEGCVSKKIWQSAQQTAEVTLQTKPILNSQTYSFAS